MVYVPTCLRSNMSKACRFSIFTCQHVSVPYGVPICFNLECQRAKWRANFSTWRANVRKGVPIFQTFLFEMLKEIYILYYIKKFYILLDIIVINIICICIVNKTCIILHFYTSCYIKEKCVEIFFLLYFSFLLFW